MFCASKKLQLTDSPTVVAQSNRCMHCPTVARRTKQLGPAIGKRLRLAKELKNLTVRELAKLAHVSSLPSVLVYAWVRCGPLGVQGRGVSSVASK